MQLKTVMVGLTGVGKTTLLYRSLNGQLNTQIGTTVGLDFISKTYQRNDQQVKLHVWDTAGQQVYQSLISNFFRGAKGVFIVLSAENPLQQNLKTLQNQLILFSQKEMPRNVIVIFNKIDLIDQKNLKFELKKNEKEINLLRSKYDIKDIFNISAYTSPLQEINKILQIMVDYTIGQQQQKKQWAIKLNRQKIMNSQLTIASQQINLKPIKPKKKSNRQVQKPKKKCCQ